MSELYTTTLKTQRFRIEAVPTITMLLIMAVATVVAFSLTFFFPNSETSAVVYMLAVVITASITSGYIYGVAAAVISALCVNYFFLSPYYAFDFRNAAYALTFSTMLIASLIISTLMSRYSDAAEDSKRLEKRSMALYTLTRAFLEADDKNACVAIACKHINSIYGLDAQFINEGEPAPSEKNTVSVPIQNAERKFGTIYLTGKASGLERGSDAEILLKMIAAQLAIAIEKTSLMQTNNAIKLEAESEKLRGNLLRAISHDLRTPLTSILGASATVIENHGRISRNEELQLIEDVHENAEWLIRTVENLLSVTKINAGTAAVKTSPELVEEVVAQAMLQVRKRFSSQEFKVSVPDELLIIPMDATLITQVLINLLENAVYHSASTQPIELTINKSENSVLFTVLDHGRGVSEAALYEIESGVTISREATSDAYRGMGIGLSLCKSIIKAHNGTLTISNAVGGGAQAVFTLPAEE